MGLFLDLAKGAGKAVAVGLYRVARMSYETTKEAGEPTKEALKAGAKAAAGTAAYGAKKILGKKDE